MACRVYIVRHGNTFDKGDTVTRVGARTDLSLSASGRAQADALAAHFSSDGIAFSRALAGPLKRTRETAEAILAAQDTPAPLEIAEFLREIDYGPDENRPEADVIARIGEAALRAWEEDATPPPGWQVDVNALQRDWKALFETLSRKEEVGPVLVITSNGIARFALMAAGGADGHTLKLKTGAYGILEVGEDGRVRVADWNIRP